MLIFFYYIIIILDSAFVVVSNEQHYIPTNDTVGGRIKLYCTPYKDDGIERIMGRTTTLYLNGVISQLPELKILSLRQEFSNTPRALDELRIMTYNILAEPYATSDYAMVFYKLFIIIINIIMKEKTIQLLPSRQSFD
jgi:hypothetical protein